MRTVLLLIISALSFLATSCIGEDIVSDTVEPMVRIENPLQSLGINESYQFQARYFNNIGQPEPAIISWSSSATDIVSIDVQTGLATALQKGQSEITATSMEPDELKATFVIEVTDETVEENTGGSGTIRSTSGYRLMGDFNLVPNATGALRLVLGDNYEASTSLPGLYVYLTNNPNSINGAYEVGRVTVFNGAHSYELPSSVSITDYNYVLYWCKPFSVKVGGGDIDRN